MKHKFINLTQRGVAHFVVPVIAFVVLFGAIGTYLLLVSNAATTTVNGTISSAWSGKCLDDYKNKSTVHNKVDLYDCNSTAAQEWKGNGATIRIHGRCMSIAGTGKSGKVVSGDKVELYACKTTTASLNASYQQWSLNGKTIVDQKSKLCLEAPGSSKPANGTAIIVAGCTSASKPSTGQSWTLPVTVTPPVTTPPTPTPPIDSTANEVVNGVANSSGTHMCLTNSGVSTTGGTKVTVSSCVGTTAQNWTVYGTKSTNSAHTIENAGLCLYPMNGGTANGDAVVLTSCSSKSNNASLLEWWEAPSKSGNQLQTDGSISNSQYCLADTDASTTNGTAVQVSPCNGKVQQAWTLPGQ